MRSSRAGVVGLVAAAAFVLGGCSGGGSDSATTRAGGASAAQSAPELATAVPDATELLTKGSPAAAVDPAALGARRQVRTADLGLRVKDVPEAAAAVRALATTAKGFVQDEKSSNDPGDGRPEVTRALSVLTLRVPESGLDAVMTRVSRLGTEISRGQSSDDVTTQYVDVASRLQTQRESVARVRTLLDRANTIGQVVQIESELTRRQADLESLENRLAALDDQSALATLTVSLSPVVTAPVAAKTPSAFFDGLQGGWDALGSSAAVALQIIGALLPFAVLALLVAVPVLMVHRRRRTAAPTA